MKSLSDCRLYGFVDTDYLADRDPLVLAENLCQGGVDLIQYRAKNQPAQIVEPTAAALLRVAQQNHVGLVINDHWDVACRVGAPVCHLGQEDFFDSGFQHKNELPTRMDGRRPLLGLSTHAPEQAVRAIAAGADYIAIGPVFPTATKPSAKAVTLDYVKWAAENVSIPWFAIGGIDMGNVEQVVAAGAKRICVVSAILKSDDVSAASRELRQRLVR